MSFGDSALPKLAAIREAQEMLRRHFSPTPLVPAPSLSKRGANVVLKNETVLPTRSFKPRGAMYALAKNLERRKVDEVVTSSTGNHGAAVAFAGRTLGVPVTIFLPENPNPVKRKNIEGLGARIVCGGCSDLVGASRMANQYAQRRGRLLSERRQRSRPAGRRGHDRRGNPGTTPECFCGFCSDGRYGVDPRDCRGVESGFSLDASHRSAGGAGAIVCAVVARGEAGSHRDLRYLR